MGKWVKYNTNYFYLGGNSPTGQTGPMIFTFDGSNDDERMCLLGFVYIAPHLWVREPQKPNFWDVNRHFPAICAKY